MILSLGAEPFLTNFVFQIEDALRTKYSKNRNFESIGVYLSGGLDSTALLLLIIEELKLTDRINKIPINCFTVGKQDFSTVVAPKIIEVCERKFNIRIGHHNNIKNKSQDQENISKNTFAECFIKYKNTLFFLGINRMPEPEIAVFKNKLKIDYGHKKDTFLYYSPFLFLHKPQIIDIFYKLGHADLLPYTYSCTIQSKIPCGKCYACEERAWGFNILQKEDPLFTQNKLTGTQY